MKNFLIVTITGVIREAYFLFNEMAPYLLFGFLFAGVLRVFIDTKAVTKHLGHNNFLAVIKASLFGIPLPLCSCSVIPAAMALRREGASKGAVLSFLISTPTTGIDSIFATYSLLGGFFAAYRVIASFITGVLSGAAANFILKETDNKPAGKDMPKCGICPRAENHSHHIRQKIKGVFSYAFGDLLRDSGPAFIAGILIGGIITYFVPKEFISTYLGSGPQAMVIMLLVGIPMYVCATASIPIAAVLMMKGMDPGAAFVFLAAGPATNIVTMTVVARNLGRKALLVYLGAIAISSISLGMALNKLYSHFYHEKAFNFIMRQRILIPREMQVLCSIILFLLILYNSLKHPGKMVSVEE